jgi:hypothetical protein
MAKSKSKASPAQARGHRRDGADDIADALTAGITDLANEAPLQYHPIADLFPLMEGKEFDELVADIKANALRSKITLHEGMILDGRNRYRATLAAGHTPNKGHFHKYEPAVPSDTPLNFVIRANLLRRHLTTEQKRDLLVKIVAAQPGKSDRQLADETGVTHPTIARARRKAAATGKGLPVGGKRTGADGKTRRPRRPSVATDARGQKWKFELDHLDGGWTWAATAEDGTWLHGGYTIDREGAREEAIDKITSYRGEADEPKLTDTKPEPEPKSIDHKPVGDPKPDPKRSNLEKQLAADRQQARDLVKLNRGTAQSLREILTNLKRREAFLDALIRALNKSSDGNDEDPVKSAEVRTAVNAAAEEKAA